MNTSPQEQLISPPGFTGGAEAEQPRQQAGLPGLSLVKIGSVNVARTLKRLFPVLALCVGTAFGADLAEQHEAKPEQAVLTCAAHDIATDEAQKVEAALRQAMAERRKAEDVLRKAINERLQAEAERRKAGEAQRLTEEAHQKAQAERKQAEAERQQAENERQKAEEARRLAAEDERQKAEEEAAKTCEECKRRPEQLPPPHTHPVATDANRQALEEAAKTCKVCQSRLASLRTPDIPRSEKCRYCNGVKEFPRQANYRRSIHLWRRGTQEGCSNCKRLLFEFERRPEQLPPPHTHPAATESNRQALEEAAKTCKECKRRLASLRTPDIPRPEKCRYCNGVKEFPRQANYRRSIHQWLQGTKEGCNNCERLLIESERRELYFHTHPVATEANRQALEEAAKTCEECKHRLAQLNSMQPSCPYCKGIKQFPGYRDSRRSLILLRRGAQNGCKNCRRMLHHVEFLPR